MRREFLSLLVVVACSTTPDRPPVIEAPPSVVDEIAAELESSEITEEKKEIILRQVKRSTDYNERAFQKINDLEARLDRLEQENKKLKDKNRELRSELDNYRKLKMIFGVVIFALLIGFVLKILIKFKII